VTRPIPPERIPSRQVLQRLYVNERRSCQSIGREFHVSASTVHRWLRLAGIPTRPPYPTYDLKTIGGIPHKLCRGPRHREGVWLPVDDFKYRKDEIRAQCNDCEREHHDVDALLDFKEPLPGILAGVVHRIGIQEASRRLGISQPTVSKLYKTFRVINGKRGLPVEQMVTRLKIRRSTAEKILLTMHELRETGEVRHKHSIKHGASQRGREEREIRTRRDYYYQTGDLENAQHRAKRKAS